MIIAPIVALVIASNIGDALAPSLVPDPDDPGSGHPLLLIALNARNRNLLAVSNHLDAWSYYVVGTLRLLAADPPFYFLGYFYGDNAVRWIESKSPTMGRYARQFESAFGKASYPLVFLAPNNPICLFAGAAGMRPAWFISLNVSGTVARLFALRVVGDVFSEPIDTVLSWIADNRLWLTGITIALVLVTVLSDRFGGARELEGITDLAAGDDPDPSAPAADPPEEQPAPAPTTSGRSISWPWRVVLAVGLAALVAAVALALIRDDGADGSTGDNGVEATPAAVLVEPQRPLVRRLGAGGCSGWAPGTVSCEVVDGDGDGEPDTAWLIALAPDGWTIEILRRADEDRWALDLVAAADRGVWRTVQATSGDAGRGRGHEVAVGFHLPGSGGLLVVELVDQRGVAVHGELDQGAARLSEHGLETWEALFEPDDPTCCPSAFRRQVIGWSEGRWQVVETSEVSPDEVPDSHL